MRATRRRYGSPTKATEVLRKHMNCSIAEKDMQLVFITHGSTGDTVPMIRLAAEAVDRGHVVTFLAASYWRETCTKRGIRFVGIPPHGGVEEHSAMMREFSGIRDNRKLLMNMFSKANQWFGEVIEALTPELKNADALVVSYLFSFYHQLSDARGIPSISVHFCPNTALSNLRCPDGVPHPPRFLPKALRKFWAEGLNRMADRYVCGLLRRSMTHPDLLPKGFLIPPTDLSLVLAPPEPFGYLPSELRQGVHFTGFLQAGFGAEHSMDSSADGVDFDEGTFISFGSVTTDSMEKEFRELYATWPMEKPLTIQAGWFTPPPPPPEKKIRIIGAAPHRICFPKASVVVHHGGAGTTTSAFFAGVPQIIAPHFADQGFWAKTVKRNGCGLRLRRSGWGKHLLKAVQTVEKDSSFGENAKRFARKYTDPKSARRAIEVVETVLNIG